MMGGVMDGIAQALTYSLHLKDGHFLEGSWDDAYYTRQWNAPPTSRCIVMPPTTERPGRRRRVRRRRRRWPPSRAPTRAPPARCRPASRSTTTSRSASRPFPTVPPIPQSPTDGLPSYEEL